MAGKHARKKAGAGLSLLKPDRAIAPGAICGAFESLPEKKQTFIKELHKNGWNKTQAGLKAGSKSPESALATANNWLKDSTVQRAIEEFQALDNKAINLCVDDLKVELWKNHLKAERVSDSNKALELILRLLGAFKDSLEVTKSIGLAQVLEDLTKATKAVGNEEEAATRDTINKFVTKDNNTNDPDNGESSPDKESEDDSDKGDLNEL